MIPIDPCGMIMGLLRSCYTTEFRFWPDQAPQKVRWYFTRPGAQVFPAWHRFSTTNYDSEGTPQSPIGELAEAQRSYTKGQAPEGATGQSFCGPLEWYQGGSPPGTPGLQRNLVGLAVCCLPAVGLGGGDVDFGGGLYAGLSGVALAYLLALLLGPLSGQSAVVWRTSLGGLDHGGFSDVLVA